MVIIFICWPKYKIGPGFYIERRQNTKGLYASIPEADETLAGKHVMIIDDVITTGATLLSCAESLCHIPDISISFFTLAAARLA